MSELKSLIQRKAESIFPELVKIRRHIHAHPELSFEEEKTMEYVSHQLDEMSIPHQTNVGGYGIVAIIEGKEPSSKVIALRGDMDALPIQEQNQVEYASQNDGVMHACGHDVHTTNLLGAVRILNELRSEFKGTIKLVFQPAEERIPGGASLMIQDGVLENPTVESMVGQHVYPEMPVGKVGFKPGMYMASSDEIYITLRGKGGHGALAHRTTDIVLVAAHLIVALQQVVSRKADPNTPTVLTIGKIIGNGATNVIPNEVKMEGTLRTFDELWRVQAKQYIKEIAEGVAQSMGAEVEVRIKHGYPFLKNDENLTMRAIQWAQEYLGEEHVEILSQRMTAEDFAYYTQQVPSCFYRLGTANRELGIQSPLHTSTFDIDEEAMKIGAGLMAWLAIKQLEE